MANLSVDGTRLNRTLLELSAFGKNAEGGVDRVAYSDYDRDARGYAMGLMNQAGLSVSVDAAGNVVGKRTGSDNNLRPIVTGSHIDTVLNGGNFDGCLGAMSAIEVAQTLKDGNLTTKHPLEFIIFQNEEQGLFGSRAIASGLQSAQLDLVSPSGKTIREGINFLGGDTNRLHEVIRAPGSIAAFVELHIEQGPILDLASKNIGVVTGIVAVYRWNVVVKGIANHAGTTPMNARKDALVAAAEFIVAVNRVVTSHSGDQVGTVGKIAALPGAVNVIPGEVQLTLELRDLEAAKVQQLYQEITLAAGQIETSRGVTFQFTVATQQQPAITSQLIRETTVQVCADLGRSYQMIQSGAGHDSQEMGRLGPMGMIFIPSVGGISHSPHEFSRPSDITNGGNALLHVLLKLDQVLIDTKR
ncbi:MAG: M20 family metallo-hydrolase [Pirellulales bacterium]